MNPAILQQQYYEDKNKNLLLKLINSCEHLGPDNQIKIHLFYILHRNNLYELSQKNIYQCLKRRIHSSKQGAIQKV